MAYPVSCNAGCYVTVITFFIKKVEVVVQILGEGGLDPSPTPCTSGCALEIYSMLLSNSDDYVSQKQLSGSDYVIRTMASMLKCHGYSTGSIQVMTAVSVTSLVSTCYA